MSETIDMNQTKVTENSPIIETRRTLSNVSECSIANSNITDCSEYLLYKLKTCIPDDESMQVYFDKCQVNCHHALTILERDLCDHTYMIMESNITDNHLMLAIEFFLSIGKYRYYSKQIINEFMEKISSSEMKKERITNIYHNIEDEDMKSFISKWM